MPTNRTQRVWLSGELIGEMSSRSRTSVAFEYNDDVLNRSPLNTPLLSCSLPTRRGRTNARAFFGGLLPEGDHRRFLAEQARCVSNDVFALLDSFGRDVAGAVWIGEEAPSTTSNGNTQQGTATYSRSTLEDEVAGLESRPLAIYDDSALSIAGIQNKLLLVLLPDGNWARPIAGYPSTHILKVDDRRHQGLVSAEDTCLAIARAAGIPAANSHVDVFSGIDCIIVERFDRRIEGENVSRLHQEDACQALGVDLERTDPRAKYESHGGPSLRQVAALLSNYSQDPRAELLKLLEQVAFTVAIGNADHHAKNFSFIHVDELHITLAPLYDTIPTGLWPSLDTRAAMSIGAAVDLPDIDSRDIVREARSWGLPEAVARGHLRDTLERIEASVLRITNTGQLDVTTWVQGNVARLLASSSLRI